MKESKLSSQQSVQTSKEGQKNDDTQDSSNSNNNDDNNNSNNNNNNNNLSTSNESINSNTINNTNSNKNDNDNVQQTFEPDSDDPKAFFDKEDSFTYHITRKEGTAENPGGLLNLRMLSSKRSIDSLGMLRLRSPSSRPTSMMSDSSTATSLNNNNFSLGPSLLNNYNNKENDGGGSNRFSNQLNQVNNNNRCSIKFENNSNNDERDGDIILKNLMSSEQPPFQQQQQQQQQLQSDEKNSHKRSLSASSDTASVTTSSSASRNRSPSNNVMSNQMPRRVSELSNYSESTNDENESLTSSNNQDIFGKSWSSEIEDKLNNFEENYQSRKLSKDNSNNSNNNSKVIETLKEEEEPQEDLASLRDNEEYLINDNDNNENDSNQDNDNSNFNSSSDNSTIINDDDCDSILYSSHPLESTKSTESKLSNNSTLRPSLTSRASSSFSSIFALGKKQDDNNNNNNNQLNTQPSLSSLSQNNDNQNSNTFLKGKFRTFSENENANNKNNNNGEIQNNKESPHIKFEFGDKTKFGITIYFAEEFDNLRNKCGVSCQLVKSLERSINWKAEGGKTKANFSKTYDERFVIKQLTTSWTVDDKHALLEWAPAYFRHVEEDKPTLLCKILGFYSIKVTPSSETKSSNPIRMDVLIMENLFHDQSISNVFDLKVSFYHINNYQINIF